LEAGQRLAMAPPGKLGLVVEGQVVHEVHSGSPWEGQLTTGELIGSRVLETHEQAHTAAVCP
jgi:hypothetical protein